MEKKQAVKIIAEAIKIYNEKFCNQNLLIIFGDIHSPSYIETKADDKNFLHLTGLTLNRKSLLRDVKDKNSNPTSVFYMKALNSRLSTDDFDFKDNTTEQKLNVLVSTLRISSNAKMFGDYASGRINLKTDKLAGSVSSFLGFVKTGNFYVPNTVMADDIRKNSRQTQRVLGVLSKSKADERYKKIESVAKKVDIEPILKQISKNVKIESSLFVDDEPHQPTKEKRPPKAYISRATLQKAARELADKRRKEPAHSAPSKKHDN